MELLKAAAEVNYLTQKKLEVEDNIESIQRKKGARKEEVASGNANAFSVLWQGVTKIASDKFKIGTGSDIQTYDTELVELNRILKDINARLEQATVKANSSSTAGTGNIVGAGSNDKKHRCKNWKKSQPRNYRSWKQNLRLALFLRLNTTRRWQS